MIEAALVLFAEHGVNGTSLQMIADHLGVSKASVYYQFHSKDDIVLAVIRPVFAELDQLAAEMETLDDGSARRLAAVAGFVELAVRHRRVTAVFYRDPAIDTLVNSHEECSAINQRLRAVLGLDATNLEDRVAMSLVTSGIYGSAMDPDLQDVPDDELHRILLKCAYRLVS
ncbi:TetR/AcrR family transcriptional regulator [Mycobacterium sp. CBMA293]|nr:TetR/AcrR family transcriptional regulator [Mycolicibacterium sp. CBMA 360]MUL59270.1 TetR/AcrR family transcriptional regulator [Mycolicibacterium sp. CBMA 335]MUL70995.1 TetR/AcrR family transcriptional regulator [Mycolicibacterium sp. CBMA 311]MUL94638.1 TetR/AcrR family transcriptional regulator [Mycolicibacterium sp. CBMA 230]MUM11758.1 TetR/AcrR family transcriptional regulator [Mycolicibacterium sp. CBMA 293]MUM32285.1 TetR/AcrR family transcriptional regulator [Mycolicibacterium sp.